jgi:hypothetical protein
MNGVELERRLEHHDEEYETRNTYCRAASTICAFRSFKLASRFAAESSHLAFPPAASSDTGAASGVTRSSRRKRLIREGAAFAGVAVELPADAPAVPTAATGVRG